MFVTCHQLTFPPLAQPVKAGTRFSDPRGMQSWVDLVGLVTYRGGISAQRWSPNWVQCRVTLFMRWMLLPLHQATVYTACCKLKGHSTTRASSVHIPTDSYPRSTYVLMCKMAHNTAKNLLLVWIISYFTVKCTNTFRLWLDLWWCL